MHKTFLTRDLLPGFPLELVGVAKFLRRSSMNAAPTVVPSAAYKKSRFDRVFSRMSGSVFGSPLQAKTNPPASGYGSAAFHGSLVPILSTRSMLEAICYVDAQD